MNLHEKLIGKTCYVETLLGPMQVMVTKAIPSEATTAIVINDGYMVSYDEAQRAVTRAETVQQAKVKTRLSEVSTRAIVDEILNRQIYKLWELKEKRGYGDVSTKIEISELLREIETLLNSNYE